MLDLGVELLGDQGGSVEVNDIRDGVHLAHLHELGNDLGSALLQAGGQFADGDLVGDGDLQLRVAGLFQLDALQALELSLALALLELLALALAALGANIAECGTQSSLCNNLCVYRLSLFL